MQQTLVGKLFSLILFAGSLSASAQSISIGGPIQPTKRDIEKSFNSISYTGRSSACGQAKSSAEQDAKKLDARTLSLGNCECDSSKRRLLPHQAGAYHLATGKFYAGDEVDVYECTVSARIIFER